MTLVAREYLQADEIVDWQHPQVLAQARSLAAGRDSEAAIARACFEWVRDDIQHSSDYQLNPVTYRASDVLRYRTGYCYAKSHLLAALLRANYIPAGLCYQRLSVFDNGAPYCLHGFNAIYLAEQGWYRADARGNRTDICAQFEPPVEQLAYQPQLPEEADFSNIFATPLPVVVTALQTYSTWDALLNGLPDVPLTELDRHGLERKDSSVGL
ncbi:MAG: transglutaminase family protein [Cyanobacteria bacterium P01_D01_bin.123]